MMRRRGVDPCAYVPGLYTEAEVDDLINIDGYIPVASAVEFDKIRTGASETMGGCSIWAGMYTTGVDKKYIQILDIDLSGFVNFNSIGVTGNLFRGVYDGNNFRILNLSQNATGVSLFDGSGVAGQPYIIKNLTVKDVIQTGAGANNAVLARTSVDGCEIINVHVMNANCSYSQGGSMVSNARGVLIKDCSFQGTITANTTSNTQRIGGICAGSGDNLSIIENCIVYDSVLSGVRGVGGIAGGNSVGANDNIEVIGCQVLNTSVTVSDRGVGGIYGRNLHTVTIKNCFVDDDCTIQSNGSTSVNECGGIAGIMFSATSEIIECFSDADVVGISGVGTGGIVGRNRGDIINCVAFGSVSGSTNVGGLVGHQEFNTSTIENSYCANNVTGTTAVGGMVGLVTNSPTFTASYWDTTVGPATSAAGTGQTTSDLQTPTSNTGIYAAWTIPPWDFGTSTDYPVLTTTP